MSVQHLFKNTLGNCQYIFKTGKIAHFLNGRYLTDQEAEIEELTAEAKSGHPHIYIDANEATVDSDAASNAMAALEARIRAKVLLELATQKDNDRGNYEVSAKLEGIVSTTDIAAAASGSASNEGAAPVANAAASPTLVTPATATPARIIAGPVVK